MKEVDLYYMLGEMQENNAEAKRGGEKLEKNTYGEGDGSQRVIQSAESCLKFNFCF